MAEIFFITFAGSFISYYITFTAGVVLNKWVDYDTKIEQRKIHDKLDAIIHNSSLEHIKLDRIINEL